MEKYKLGPELNAEAELSWEAVAPIDAVNLKKLHTPVLLMIFNRPEPTKQIVETIRKISPERLYVAADGPREGRPGESEACEEAQRIVENAGLECQIYTRFSPTNQGPMHAQIAALDWFFQHEEEGIILEDDCLPSSSFFRYCEELLNKYRNDNRIFMISGNNFQAGKKRGDGDYYFSIYTHIWGWATWRRAWARLDKSLSTWPEFKKSGSIRSLHLARETRNYWSSLFESIHCGQYQRGWDYRFLYSCWKENGLVVIPNLNLVTNIGFGKLATNCLDAESEWANMDRGDLSFPLVHPSIVQRNVEADELTSRLMFRKPSLLSRIKSAAMDPARMYKKLLNRVKEGI